LEEKVRKKLKIPPEAPDAPDAPVKHHHSRKAQKKENEFVGRVVIPLKAGELPDNLLTHRIPATSNDEKNEKQPSACPVSPACPASPANRSSAAGS